MKKLACPVCGGQDIELVGVSEANNAVKLHCKNPEVDVWGESGHAFVLVFVQAEDGVIVLTHSRASKSRSGVKVVR